MNLSEESVISLEPRLQEYVSRKKYYKDNNIEPSYSVEKQYQITSLDIQIIKDYLRGNTKVYDKVAKMHKQDPREDPNQKKFTFPSKELLNDKRVLKMQKVPNNEVPINRGMFASDDTNNNSSNSSRFYEDVTITNNNDMLLNSRDLPKFTYANQSQGSNTRGSNSSRYSQFNSIPSSNSREQHREQNKRFNQEYNNNNYRNTSRFSNPSSMDSKHKMVIPNIGITSKSDLDYSDYRLQNFFEEDDTTMDSGLESDLTRGMQSGRIHNKSYGYRNPFENYFDFVDNTDNSNPTESWTRGGTATRLDNKTIAKKRVYKREIM
jgi:hypothetical protein